jgi:hypothetical protein
LAGLRRRKHNEGGQRIAGISPYDGNGLIIHLSFIDNFLSIFGVRRQGQKPSRGKTPLFKAQRVALSQSADISHEGSCPCPRNPNKRPYDGNESIIYFSFIDNNLSMFLR